MTTARRPIPQPVPRRPRRPGWQRYGLAIFGMFVVFLLARILFGIHPSTAEIITVCAAVFVWDSILEAMR